MPPTILLATDPQAPQPLPVLCAEAPGGEPNQVPAGTPRAMECAVLRPIDLSSTHGVNVTPEILRAMVSSYDPAYEAAALNFDHAWGGPAHGWCTKIWMQGEMLWARFEQLSADAVEALTSGRWPRRSSEFYLQHPQAKVPYFIGMALLGNSTPAVPGLPAATLLSRPRTIVLHTVAESAAAAVAATAPQKEQQMSEKTPEPAPAPESAPATTASADPAPPPDPANLAAERERLEAAVAAAEAEKAQARSERLAARRERAEASTDKLLAELGARVTPAMLKAGLRALLVELAAAEAPAVVKLTADGAETPIHQSLVAILTAAPEQKVLDAERLADRDPDDDARLPAVVALHSRFGLTKERVAELARKYPTN